MLNIAEANDIQEFLRHLDDLIITGFNESNLKFNDFRKQEIFDIFDAFICQFEHIANIPDFSTNTQLHTKLFHIIKWGFD